MKKGVKILLGIVLAILVVLVISFLAMRVSSRMGYDYPGATGLGLSYDSSRGESYGASYGAGVVGGMAVRSASIKSSSNQEAVAPTAATTERMIVRSGELSLVVKDVPAAIKSISDYIEKNDGFVVSSQISKTGLSPYGELTVRIPAKTFDASVNEIKASGEVKSQNIRGQDVTEEYIDLDAQLRNLQATEKQFLTILEKAEKITDILAVQNELSRVRSNIEVLQGRMKYLKTSADMSSLTIYLSTDPDVLPTVEDSNQWKPLSVLKSSVRGLIEVGKTLANVIIWFVVFIPLWIVIVLLVLLGRRIVRRFYPKDEGMNFKR